MAAVTVSQAEFARQIGKSRQYVNKLVKSGKIPLAEDGKIDPEAAKDALKQLADPSHQKTEPVQPEQDKSAPTVASHRIRREEWAAQLAELDYKERSGRLVDKDEVEREQFDTARQLRERIMAVSQDVAGVLVGMADEREISVFLRNRLRDALAGAADDVWPSERK